MVAARDDLSQADARAYVDDVIRLAAAAEAERTRVPDPPDALTEARRRFLRRAAQARVWLHDVFEPTHRAEDIDASDPVLTRALASSKHVHPRVHLLCQLVAVPSGFDDDRAGLLAQAADPQWQARAATRFEPVANRLQRYVRADDPQACRLMGKLLRFETQDADGVVLRVETKGFDLDACTRRAADGTCEEPQWASEWVEQVARAEPPGFIPAFRSRFGHHLVFVLEVLPSQRLEEPDTLATVRTQIRPAWRAALLDAAIDSFRKKWAVRTVSSEDTP